jgi:hypothetical protein
VRRLEELRLAQTCSLSQLQPIWGLVRLVLVQRRFALHLRPVLAVEHPIPDRRIGKFIQRIGKHPVPDVPLALFHLHIRGEKHVCPRAAGGHLRGTALHARFVRRDLVQISVLLRVSPELEVLACIIFHVGDLCRLVDATKEAEETATAAAAAAALSATEEAQVILSGSTATAAC